jgi:hypothetical protein
LYNGTGIYTNLNKKDKKIKIILKHACIIYTHFLTLTAFYGPHTRKAGVALMF